MTDVPMNCYFDTVAEPDDATRDEVKVAAIGGSDGRVTDVVIEGVSRKPTDREVFRTHFGLIAEPPVSPEQDIFLDPILDAVAKVGGVVIADCDAEINWKENVGGFGPIDPNRA